MGDRDRDRDREDGRGRGLIGQEMKATQPRESHVALLDGLIEF